MTLLIAFLLMNHMGVENNFAYVGVTFLWLFHLCARNTTITKTITTNIKSYRR